MKTYFLLSAMLALILVLPAVGQQSDAQPQNLEMQVGNLRTGVDTLQVEVRNLQSNVNRLRSEVGSGATVFLFGVVCALWAQNSGRNPWLWFFLGLIFSVITGLVMLYKNSKDRQSVRQRG